MRISKNKIVFFAIALIIFNAYFISYATPIDSLVAEIRYDNVNKKVLIFGNTTAGPGHLISLAIYDVNNTLVAPYIEDSVELGRFNFSLDSLSNGNYTLKFNSLNCNEVIKTISVPMSDTKTQIQASKIIQYALMQKVNNIDNIDDNFNKFQLKVNNGVVKKGIIPKEDYEINGLFDGVDIVAYGKDDNIIDLFILVNTTSSITCDINISLKLKSSILIGGSANSDSEMLIGFKIFNSNKSNTVILNPEVSEMSFKMESLSQPFSTQNSIEFEILARKLLVDGKLTKGTHFNYDNNSELTGLTIEGVADETSNKIKFTLTGASLNNITENKKIANFIVKSICTENATQDSSPISVNILKATANVPETPSGNSGNIGNNGNSEATNNGNGGSVGIFNIPNITQPTKQEIVIEPIVPLEYITFGDIQSHWAKESIELLASIKVIKGGEEGLFKPEDNVTRAEFVAMVSRALWDKVDEYNNSFTDVKQTDWFANAVNTALNKKIISQNQKFRPNDNITREEIAKIATLAWLVNNAKPEWVTDGAFLKDYNEISTWAKEYVDLGITIGLLKGNDKQNFLAKNFLTRGEAATIIRRMLENNIKIY